MEYGELTGSFDVLPGRSKAFIDFRDGVRYVETDWEGPSLSMTINDNVRCMEKV